MIQTHIWRIIGKHSFREGKQRKLRIKPACWISGSKRFISFKPLSCKNVLNLILQECFPNILVLATELPSPTKKTYVDPPDINQIKTAALVKWGSGRIFWTPRHPCISKPSQRVIWKMLFQHNPNWLKSCNSANFCPGGTVSLALWFERPPGAKGALETAVPRLLSHLAPHLGMSQVCSLEAVPLFQPDLHKGIVLKHWPSFLDWPLFTHPVAGGSWIVPLWFCGSGAAG